MPIPDHYIYDDMPAELRQKIIFRMDDTLGLRDVVWEYIEKTLIREYGRPFLVNGPNPERNVTEFLKKCEAKEAVDVVEIFLSEIKSSPFPQPPLPPRPNLPFPPRPISFEDNLRHTNEIFREHGVGYEFSEEAGNEVRADRIDSEYLHVKAIKKTLKLLRDLNFEGPLEEFDDAIEALDNQDTDTAITEALKAFESTMKAILQEEGHTFNPKWTATKLIDACIGADIIPTNLGSLSAGIRTVLESGLTTIRNVAAHGTGHDPKDIERSYAQFAVNLCGSYIVFLIERYEEKK
jgi:hypothetical protein